MRLILKGRLAERPALAQNAGLSLAIAVRKGVHYSYTDLA
jgi:hypothetical protein